MPPSLVGKKALWMFEYHDRNSAIPESAEQSATELAVAAKNLAGCDTLFQKVANAGNFQSAFDQGQNAIGSYGMWNQAVADGKAAGVDFIPWVVPTNRTQARFHAGFGKRIVIDLEDDVTYFWNDTIPNISGYFDDLRVNGVQEIYVSIDPRQNHVDYLHVAEWAASVEGLVGQHYWTDFQRPPSETLQDVKALLQLTPYVFPVLPWNGAQPDMQFFWDSSVAWGCTGGSLWRLGPPNATQLGYFANLKVPPAPVVTPPAPIDTTCQQKLSDMTLQRDTLQHMIDKLRVDLAPPPTGGRR